MWPREGQNSFWLGFFPYPGRDFQAIVRFTATSGAGQDPNSQASISGSAAPNLPIHSSFEAFMQAAKKQRIFLPPGTEPVSQSTLPSVLPL